MLERVDAALGKIEPSEQVDGIKQEATSLDLLQAVYRNPQVPLPVRMRAAGMAIPYEFPKLSVVANIDNQDFANRLEVAIKRSCVKLTIEHVPQARPVLPAPEPTSPAGPMLATERKGRRL